MKQSPPKQYVSVHVRLDPLTPERMGRLQRLWGRSLPKSLEAAFKNWEHNGVLPYLDDKAREQYFLGAPRLGAFRELRARQKPFDCAVDLDADEDDTIWSAL
jgi:hypothetical protein